MIYPRSVAVSGKEAVLIVVNRYVVAHRAEIAGLTKFDRSSNGTVLGLSVHGHGTTAAILHAAEGAIVAEIAETHGRRG